VGGEEKRPQLVRKGEGQTRGGARGWGAKVTGAASVSSDKEKGQSDYKVTTKLATQAR